LNLSQFKKRKRGQTWPDVAATFGTSVHNIYRWSKDPNITVKRVDGAWVVFQKKAIAWEA
jgi:hypothetical protein